MSARKPKAAAPVTAAGVRKDLVRLLRENAHARHMWEVWRDFIEMAAIAISNSVDVHQREEREARYLAIAGRYTREQLDRFGSALGALTCALEEEPTDVLGETYMELEISNSAAGQFFTPMALCRVMSGVQVDDELKAKIAERGFITASDPAVGAGATLIAFALELRDAGVNYQQHLHVVGQDIDAGAAHMAYVQLSLLGVPGVIVVGDTLRLETRSRWYTPMHVLGGWSQRLRGGWPLSDLPRLIEAALALEAPANTTSEAAAVPGEDNPASAARSSSRERPRPAEAQASDAGNVAEPCRCGAWLARCADHASTHPLERARAEHRCTTRRTA